MKIPLEILEFLFFFIWLWYKKGMAISYVFCAQPNYINSQIVKVEIDITKGMYQFSIVGMASKSVDEARERVSSAIKNSSFQAMKSRHERITVSLSPAEVKKSGAVYDLAIATAYLLARGEISFHPDSKLFIGELGLDGKLLPVTSVLSMLEYARNSGFTECFIPEKNFNEACLLYGIKIYPVNSLEELVGHFKGTTRIDYLYQSYEEVSKKYLKQHGQYRDSESFSKIVGQDFAKRGLLLAALGKHHVCLYGPPGTGKTMLAKAFRDIIPNLHYREILEVQSISTEIKNDLKIIMRPPFRNPHHSASYSAIIGGGKNLQAGEISLAHHGILFLDEFPEFDRRVIESLRQPLEDGYINIARSQGSVTFPARFILVAAMNPCPCGYYGSSVKTCTCSAYQIARYQKKISGPITDRIDIWIPVSHVSFEEFDLRQNEIDNNQSFNEIQNTLLQAIDFKNKRIDKQLKETRKLMHNNRAGENDNRLVPNEIIFDISVKNQNMLRGFAERLHLSPRSYYRVIRLARTIADIEQSKEITENHILEALQYRRQE